MHLRLQELWQLHFLHIAINPFRLYLKTLEELLPVGLAAFWVRPRPFLLLSLWQMVPVLAERCLNRLRFGREKLVVVASLFALTRFEVSESEVSLAVFAFWNRYFKFSASVACIAQHMLSSLADRGACAHLAIVSHEV